MQRTAGMQRLHQVIGVTYGNVSLYPFIERFLRKSLFTRKQFVSWRTQRAWSENPLVKGRVGEGLTDIYTTSYTTDEWPH